MINNNNNDDDEGPGPNLFADDFIIFFSHLFQSEN